MSGMATYDPREPANPVQAPPGWYPDTRGVQRYWDGAQWVPVRLSNEERVDILNRALIEARIKAPGMRVESQTAYQAVCVYGEKANHILHLLIALFTCGLWVIVWAFMAMGSGETRITVTVDPYGNVSWIR